MAGLNVDDWVAYEPSNEWETMMKKVAKFHHKHDFAGKMVMIWVIELRLL